MSKQFSKYFPLRKARAHEVCGAGAIGFAAIACGLTKGPVVWVSETWQTEQLNPVGLAQFCDPQRLLLARSKDQADSLAVSEEALRSGAVPMVVIEVREPLTLIAGRRLQLAAEAGSSTGLLIIPEGKGSNAAQTRWQCTPLFDPQDSTLQRWKLIKNKSGTLSAWDVRWDAEAHRIIVVSEIGERPDIAR